MKKLVALLILALAFITAPAFAGWDEGVVAYDKGDYVTAFPELQPFAEQGNAVAQFALGWMYDNGLGVPEDDKQAVKWYTLSAEQGDAGAQFNLGVLHENGDGVPQDYKTAVKWYRLSAEQGDDAAQYNLGQLYRIGQGVLQDHVLAHMWYNIAASNGQELAPKNRDIIAKEMTPAQLEKARNLARACVAKDYKGC